MMRRARRASKGDLLPTRTEDSDVSLEEIDRDFAELARLCEFSDPNDEARLQQALEAATLQSKEQVRRQMGLGE